MSTSIGSAAPSSVPEANVIAATVLSRPGPAPGARRAAGGGGALSREQILDATHACFRGFGYDGTTIRAIAGRLDCAVGSIYRYFTDKRELLLACAEAVFEPLLERTRQGGLDAEASLQRFTTMAAEHDELYRLLFWLSAAGDRPGTPTIIQKLLDAWAGQAGQGSAIDWRTRWATAHGLLMLGAPVADIISRVSAAPAPAGAPTSVAEHAPVATPAATAEPAPEPATEEADELDVTLL